MPDTHIQQIKDKIAVHASIVPISSLNVDIQSMYDGISFGQEPNDIRWIRKLLRESLMDFTVICDTLQLTSSADEEHPE